MGNIAKPVTIESLDTVTKCGICKKMIYQFGWVHIKCIKSNICVNCKESITIKQFSQHIIDKYKHGHNLLFKAIKQLTSK